MVYVDKTMDIHVCYRDSFQWNLATVTPQSKLWRLTTWIPWDTRLRHTPDTIRAYLEYKITNNITAAKVNLEKVIKIDPGNLFALRTLLQIHNEEGDDEESEKVENIIESRTNKTTLRQAKHEEAHCYLMIGSKCLYLAQSILEQLFEENPQDTEVLLDFISSMIKQINRESFSNVLITTKFLDHIVCYINRAVETSPHESRVYTLVLQMIVAVKTYSLDRQWIKTFWKTHPHLKPSECIQVGLKNKHRDNRDVSLYGIIIQYYDTCYKRDDAYHMTLEALSYFPQEKIFLLRQASHLIDEAKDNFKTFKTVDQDLILKPMTMLLTLWEATQWEYRYKVAMHLGTANYLKCNFVEAYNFYKQSLTLFMEEFGDSPEISQIYFNWCFVLVLSNEAGIDTVRLFPHMRAALRINEHLVKEVALRSLPLIFSKALEENPDSTFYKLCNGYLQLEFGKLQEAEQYFLHAISDRRTGHTLLALAEREAACGQLKSASQWLVEAKQLLSEDTDEALKDQIATLENKLGQDKTRTMRTERVPPAYGKKTTDNKYKHVPGRQAPERTDYLLSWSTTGPMSPTIWISCGDSAAATLGTDETCLLDSARESMKHFEKPYLRQTTLNKIADGDTVAVSESITRTDGHCVQHDNEKTHEVADGLTDLIPSAKNLKSTKITSHNALQPNGIARRITSKGTGKANSASQEKQILPYQYNKSCVTYDHFVIYSWQTRHVCTGLISIILEYFQPGCIY